MAKQVNAKLHCRLWPVPLPRLAARMASITAAGTSNPSMPSSLPERRRKCRPATEARLFCRWLRTTLLQLDYQCPKRAEDGEPALRHCLEQIPFVEFEFKARNDHGAIGLKPHRVT